MVVKCPACGKPNTPSASINCQRCGCELGALYLINHAAALHLAGSARGFKSGAWQVALFEAERSWDLIHTLYSARLAFLAAAALGDTDSATLWRKRVRAWAGN